MRRNLLLLTFLLTCILNSSIYRDRLLNIFCKLLQSYDWTVAKRFLWNTYCVCALAHNALELPFFYFFIFFFSFSTGFWPDWQFFFAYVLLVVAFTEWEPAFTGHINKYLCGDSVYCHFRYVWPRAPASTKSWTRVWKLLSKLQY